MRSRASRLQHRPALPNYVLAWSDGRDESQRVPAPRSVLVNDKRPYQRAFIKFELSLTGSSFFFFSSRCPFKRIQTPRDTAYSSSFLLLSFVFPFFFFATTSFAHFILFFLFFSFFLTHATHDVQFYSCSTYFLPNLWLILFDFTSQSSVAMFFSHS